MKCDCIEKLAAILRDEAALWHAADDRNLARAFTVVADRLAPPAEAARGGPGEANPNLSPSTVRALRHGMNCSGRAGDESGCTCGLLWRDQLETERTMHAAWRKRAEEAEAALAAASPPVQPAPQPATAEFDAEKWAERVRYHIDNSPSVNRVEIIASEGGLLWLSAYAAGLVAQQPKTFAGEKVEGVTVLKWSDARGGEWQQWPTRWLERGMVYQPMPPSPKEVR